jgi:hypothetical protein
MPAIIVNQWKSLEGAGPARSVILSRETSPEGLDVERLRFAQDGEVTPPSDSAHVISALRGRGLLSCSLGRLAIEPGVHAFLPAGERATVTASAGLELVIVSGPRARGTRAIVRDEAFVRACATEKQSLRWVLTPQYLSRRIFLHHDEVLISRRGHPISWFHTTMFDVAGLPQNEEGESVFKMAYTSRTEFNVCYDVSGRARVRMGKHPYRPGRDGWAAWSDIDGETTYHLDEVEVASDGVRNKHEVSAVGGHVTLFCAFDPAPTGIERHQLGEYSDYEPFERVSARPEYQAHRESIGRYDQMVERLSLAKAKGELDACRGTPEWEVYLAGRRAQQAHETALVAGATPERARVLERWLDTAPVTG